MKGPRKKGEKSEGRKAMKKGVKEGGRKQASSTETLENRMQWEGSNGMAGDCRKNERREGSKCKGEYIWGGEQGRMDVTEGRTPKEEQKAW